MKPYTLNLDAVADAAFKIEDDTFYNLFLGGYLDPEDLLSSEIEAQEVREAMKVVRAYVDQLQDAIIDLEENEEEEE